jgi:immunity protein 42 of polymorphic toxin system
MFGRFCYWCGGRRVGDFELGTSLRDVLFQLEYLMRDRHLRASRRFSTMPATDVFRLLHGAQFGAAELNNASVAEEEQWARHNIAPSVDVFDSWNGFLIEGEQTARFIFARKPHLEVAELSLKAGEVDAVLDGARKALDDIYEHELNERATD